MIALDKIKIAVVGLGYVGLPLAVAFGRQYETIGFDIKSERIRELLAGRDSTLEVEADELATVRSLTYTDRETDLEQCNVYVVTVPTPVTASKMPDLSPVESASRCIARCLKKGDMVVYESTVYPGVTEEICAAILEEGSGLKYNQDFYLGYSPERINPGDKQHRIESIKKVTSGSTPDAAKFIDRLYASIITAGTYMASSIRVAEAAKVIENTQRDVNIALINELSILFSKLNIDTLEVLEAAGTKWNFLPFRPGLVGGHCIGVDPYYLTYKAKQVDYDPEIILAGRRINDGMGKYVAESVIKLMLAKNIHAAGARVLIMGFTFKENCPDVRNTRVIDIVEELRSYHCVIDVYDPCASNREILEGYDIKPLEQLGDTKYSAVIFAVAHAQFLAMGEKEILSLLEDEHVIYDVKGILKKELVDGRL